MSCPECGGLLVVTRECSCRGFDAECPDCHGEATVERECPACMSPARLSAPRVEPVELGGELLGRVELLDDDGGDDDGCF